MTFHYLFDAFGLVTCVYFCFDQFTDQYVPGHHDTRLNYFLCFWTDGVGCLHEQCYFFGIDNKRLHFSVNTFLEALH